MNIYIYIYISPCRVSSHTVCLCTLNLKFKKWPPRGPRWAPPRLQLSSAPSKTPNSTLKVLWSRENFGNRGAAIPTINYSKTRSCALTLPQPPSPRMARPRAGKPLPGARPLPMCSESTADAVAAAESSRGRHMVSSPAATQKSERIF